MALPVPKLYSTAGLAGQLASLDLFRISGTIPKYRNRGAAVIPLGRAVIKQTTPADGVALISATGQKVLGFSVKNDTLYLPDNGTEGYQLLAMVDVLTMGDIWVPTEVAVSPDDPVYVRHTANASLNVIGGVANAAGTGLDLLAGAKFKSTRMDGLAVVTLNIQ